MLNRKKELNMWVILEDKNTELKGFTIANHVIEDENQSILSVPLQRG